MGYSLSGSGGTFEANGASFQYFHELAIDYGWNPAGTRFPERHMALMLSLGDDATVENNDEMRQRADRWEGDYFSNSYQRVTADDARAWAAALRKAKAMRPEAAEDEELERFIRFCSAGQFTIG